MKPAAGVWFRCAACGRRKLYTTEEEAKADGWRRYWLAWTCRAACFDALALREDLHER